MIERQSRSWTFRSLGPDVVLSLPLPSKTINQTCVRVLTSPFGGCVTLNKLVNLSEDT